MRCTVRYLKTWREYYRADVPFMRGFDRQVKMNGIIFADLDAFLTRQVVGRRVQAAVNIDDVFPRQRVRRQPPPRGGGSSVTDKR